MSETMRRSPKSIRRTGNGFAWIAVIGSRLPRSPRTTAMFAIYWLMTSSQIWRKGPRGEAISPKHSRSNVPILDAVTMATQD